MNPECRSIETLRQVLLYLFCGVHSALLSSTPVAQKETYTHTSSQCVHLGVQISQLLGSKYIFTRQLPIRCRQENPPFEFAKAAQLEKIANSKICQSCFIGILLVKSLNYLVEDVLKILSCSIFIFFKHTHNFSFWTKYWTEIWCD